MVTRTDGSATVVSCPVCGHEMTVQPGYQHGGTIFEFASCTNRPCPIVSIRIEWRGAP